MGKRPNARRASKRRMERGCMFMNDVRTLEKVEGETLLISCRISPVLKGAYTTGVSQKRIWSVTVHKCGISLNLKENALKKEPTPSVRRTICRIITGRYQNAPCESGIPSMSANRRNSINLVQKIIRLVHAEASRKRGGHTFRFWRIGNFFCGTAMRALVAMEKYSHRISPRNKYSGYEGIS